MILQFSRQGGRTTKKSLLKRPRQTRACDIFFCALDLSDRSVWLLECLVKLPVQPFNATCKLLSHKKMVLLYMWRQGANEITTQKEFLQGYNMVSLSMKLQEEAIAMLYQPNTFIIWKYTRETYGQLEQCLYVDDVSTFVEIKKYVIFQSFYHWSCHQIPCSTEHTHVFTLKALWDPTRVNNPKSQWRRSY